MNPLESLEIIKSDIHYKDRNEFYPIRNKFIQKYKKHLNLIESILILPLSVTYLVGIFNHPLYLKYILHEKTSLMIF